jgi:hypothetical protein
MELKERLDPRRISAREEEITHRAYRLLSAHPAIELVGDVGPENRLPIFSFNIRVGSSWLHPRFVTRLLNDLFGIQSRAGCSCAAPYGHRILHIDRQKSEALRRTIACGNIGLKPGWSRVNFHFLHTDEEVDFICRAILFVAENGKQFLPLYSFDVQKGTWLHRDFTPQPVTFGLAEALSAPRRSEPEDKAAPLPALLRGYLEEAEAIVRKLERSWSETEMKSTEEKLIPFVYV